ncbi:MAG: C_GCAxxG_C_C family protein, partial [Desulfobacteraceae bacterium]
MAAGISLGGRRGLRGRIGPLGDPKGPARVFPRRGPKARPDMLNDVSLRILQLSGQGYGCSQVLMQLALEARGEDNPGLVRAMAGLEYGCGGGRATCGALTAACCVLALYAGRGGDASGTDRLPLMLQALSDWFE